MIWNRKNKNKKIEVECRQTVSVNNWHMGGAYQLDSLTGRYKNKIKSKKWYFRLFYHLLDLTIVNSWLLYKRCNLDKNIEPKLSLATFCTELSVALCKCGTPVTPSTGRPKNEIQN